MPNGATAPGKVCPSPPVPMKGSTESIGAAVEGHGGGEIGAVCAVAMLAAVPRHRAAMTVMRFIGALDHKSPGR